MKKLILLLFAPIFLHAQDQQKSMPTTTTTTFPTIVSSENTPTSIFNRKHEIRVGAVRLLAGPLFEGTYEYIYSKDFTFGGAMQASLMTGPFEEKFSITPFARMYFTETKEYGAKGFFVEGFAKYFNGDYQYNSGNSSKEISSSHFALGFSLGKKWINSSGFVVELLAGGGRVFSPKYNQPEGIFRGDLNIGYRF